MSKCFVIGLLALVSAGHQCLAADMPTRLVDPHVVEQPTWRWQGAYAGISGSYLRQSYSADYRLYPNLPGFNGSQTFKFDTATFSGHLGYNYQPFSMVVLGAEVEGTVPLRRVYSDEISQGFGDRYKVSPDGIGVVKGRLGIALDRYLVYGLGGFSVTSASYCYTDPSQAGNSFRRHSTRGGYVVGGGIESFITSNITARVEYNHLSFQRTSLYYEPQPTDNVTEFKTSYTKVSFGLGYKF